MVTDFGIDLAAYSIYWYCDSSVYRRLERNSLYSSYGGDDVSRGILIKR